MFSSPDMSYTESRPRALRWRPHVIPDSLQSVRERLDRLQISEVCWEPYEDHRAEHPFPDIAWYSGCIKCGQVVEPYHPERVLRQFGYIQTIPPRPFTPPRPDRSSLLVQYWERWTDHLLTDHSRGRRCLYSGSGESVPEYMAWYERISHRIVTPPQLRSGSTTDAGSCMPSHAASTSDTVS